MFFMEIFSKIKRIFALLTVACTFSSCLGNEGKDKHLHHIDIPIEAMEAMSSASSSDLKEEKPAPAWKLWRPWKFWQWGRTLISEGFSSSGDMVQSASRRLHNLGTRAVDWGFRRLLYESPCGKRLSAIAVVENPLLPANKQMLLIGSQAGPVAQHQAKRRWWILEAKESIVCCWVTGVESDDDESKSETQSESSIVHSTAESPHTSSLLLASTKGTVHFINGNLYEGNLLKNRMHGDGCFQWADGTIYRGQFKDNRITGTGIIEFKNNTWYEGEFLNNVRHGRGLYVDSGKQQAYYGHWSGGAKNGQGVMYYTKTFQNSYEGEWRDNLRHGSGLRRYCSKSGYDGDWNSNIREGNGLMIWPNSDMFEGEWKNNLMCGDGKYIWSSFRNDSMSLPALCVYRGSWEGGLRNGRGVVDFGFGTGSGYRGQFKSNRKNGTGQLVTNNGILQDVQFLDDNIATLKYKDDTVDTLNVEENKKAIDMCKELELDYHVRNTFQVCAVFRDNKVIKEYLEANYNITKEHNDVVTDFKELMEFEISCLRKSLMYYQAELKRIYHMYATVCNEKGIDFEKTVLIRLYLWQMYYDCRIHNKGLTLHEIDELLGRNKKWQAKEVHDPFEEIYFWQFLHSLISVATHIYGKKYIANRKPDSVLASAFRQFIDNDVLPQVGKKRGKFANGYGRVIPLKNLYKIYLSLDSPCILRSLICKIFQEDKCKETNNTDTRKIFRGNNAYIYDNEVSFLFDNIASYAFDVDLVPKSWDLSCLNNVPPKTAIEIFSKIFPQITDAKKVMILETKLTFFEFFEAFIAMVEESVKLAEIANFSFV
ncbi:LOW QUALITY PROTEIN: radial spoke head 10 homolog B-like [Aricia agestis]|uniref:LOW QUALITY PROTEIN: radial spoke head 10 homolog B-like n=1 Tax=Aricia agestis TaxID=91739 RepID=UPI001C2044DD|nr:LOW QUALITY PROTEIN: radial spoke head 10 homolog B-like [Aricia agestis]